MNRKMEEKVSIRPSKANLEKLLKEKNNELERFKREHRIEAALEKIRSHTMTMQRSDDLREVVAELFQQLKKLGFDTHACAIVLYDKKNGSVTHWISGFTKKIYPQSYKHPFFNHPYFLDQLEAWEKGIPKKVFTFKGKLKKSYDELIFTLGDLKNFPEYAKKEISSLEAIILSDAFMKYGMIEVFGNEPLPEENLNILKRFASVFEQTYTRFLDLQKAEAQAREAQIEAALERIRAKAMAMRNSNELIEVANTIREQMRLLGQPELESIFVILYDEKNFTEEEWFAFKPPKASRKKPLTGSFKWRLDENEVVKKLYKIYKSGKEEAIFDVKGKDLKEILEGVMEKFPAYIEYWDGILPDKIIHYVTRFSGGHLLMTSYESTAEQSKELQRRVTKAFDLAFKRFLDLKKTEEQAREAEIQLALERVRARTMAMHRSAELREVVNVFFEQLHPFGFAKWGFQLRIINEDQSGFFTWLSSPAQRVLPEQYFVPTLDHWALKKFWTIYKNQVGFDTIEVKGEDKLKFDLLCFEKSELKNLPDNVKENILSHDYVLFSCASMKYGLLEAIDVEHIQKEEIDILMRFAKVFEQTYTRFLDLKRAEKQVREAEIQLALERVRARTMAMHQSNELSEAGSVLFEQLIVLGIEAESSWITLIKPEEDSMTIWLTHGTQMAPPRKVNASDHPNFKAEIESWKSGQEFIKISMTKGAFNLASRETFDMELENDYPEEKLVHIQNIRHRFGYLGLATLEPISDQDIAIYNRFTKVFEQTYTRFLDLQKAEAQAREAQIEASLERIRARSMGMHESHELKEVIACIFEQLQDLDFVVPACSLILYQEDLSAQHWFAGYSHDVYPESYTIPFIDIPYYTDMLKSWQKGQEYGEFIMKGKAKVNYAKWLLNESDFKNLPREFVEQSDMLTPAPMYFADAFNKYGMVEVIGNESMPEDKANILKRVSKVFEQTYTRFLDLQKAEAQILETEIQLALERVRARTMAMHKSDELKEVILVLFQQLQVLGFDVMGCTLVLRDEQGTAEFWFSGYSDVNYPESYKIPYFDHPYFIDQLKTWKDGTPFKVFIYEGDYKKKYDNYIFEHTEFKYLPTEVKAGLSSLDKAFISDAFMKYGAIEVVSIEPLPEEKVNILKRLASVFEQTYTRFLDLKKAEAQAREAKIEAALERIRSRTMAMQRTNELLEVAGLLYKELFNLGIASLTSGYVLMDKDEKIGWNYDSSPEDGSIMPEPLGIPHSETEVMRSITASWKKQEPFHVIELDPKETIEHQTFIAERTPNFPYTAAELISFSPERLVLHTFNFKEGYILMINGVRLATDQIKMMIRFTQAFELTYTRFLDLQRAEAQTREAEIQLALERVRARTMAMHKSEELSEAATLLYQELVSLGINQIFNCGYVEVDEQKRIQHGWSTSPSGDFMEGYKLPLTGDPVLDRRYEGWVRKDPVSFEEVGGIALKKHIQFVSPHFGSKEVDDMVRTQFPNPAFFYCGNFTYGYLSIIAHNTLNEEQVSLLARFTKAFEQTYTRFLDLQKAEAQAREAQIETALERIRARALAMHSSEELLEVANILREQMGNLGQPGLQTSVIHLYDDSETFESWYAFRRPGQKKGKIFSGTTHFSVDATALTRKWMSMYRSELHEYTIKATGAELNEWLAERNRKVPEIKKFMDKSPPVQYYQFSDFSGGSLVMVSFEEPSQESKDLQRRAASVFDLAYRRCLDLIQAETSEREAIKQSSLDRVRAEIASMRTAMDLNRIIPLIWRELKTLGVPFFRCGVFIVDDPLKKVNIFLSNPEGETLAGWQSDWDSTPLFKAIVNSWKKQKVYRTEWDKNQFISFTRTLIDQGLIDNPRRYQAGKDAPEYLALQMIPFKQGMLYVGCSEKLKEDQIEMVHSLADAFSVAYARYEDFIQLENANSSLEKTLEELKSTQSQLIHSEKMASLGELTAGIAHEIQNPLNFVNNFSDVSGEMISELLEELNNGDIDEVKLISDDVIQNLQKIRHHGQRASEIVKSMLHHSRSSTGEKEPTDINTLCDEYLRLAYHGMRAKDKSFNAEYKLELDPDLPKVNVVPQDIGRVLLNLINNAFQAGSLKAEAGSKGYLPEVTVSTKAIPLPGGARGGFKEVQITIQDNGPGIPEDIRDKIFQPFFTTKPAGQGTGLGLSLSYDIVKAHGGVLRVETERAQGSEFILYLPVE